MLRSILMRRLSFIPVVVALLVVIIPGCGNHDDISTIERIERDGVMLVGTDATYIPFEYVSTETSKPEGFDIDLMNRLCIELGVKSF